MKYKIIENNKTNIQIFCLYDDNTFTTLDLVAGRELEEILQDAYILSKNKENRQAYTGEEIEDLKDYVAKPKIARFEANFYNLTGKVYDQYGDIFDASISFEIEGTDKAKIENNQVIEEEVTEQTSYFIIAKVGDLEERQERFLYPKPEIKDKPKEQEVTNTLLKTVSDLQLEVAMLKAKGGK